MCLCTLGPPTSWGTSIIWGQHPFRTWLGEELVFFCVEWRSGLNCNVQPIKHDAKWVTNCPNWISQSNCDSKGPCRTELWVPVPARRSPLWYRWGPLWLPYVSFSLIKDRISEIFVLHMLWPWNSEGLGNSSAGYTLGYRNGIFCKCLGSQLIAISLPSCASYTI